ncbi:MAG: ACT domain-containing protein [Alcaligenaceae bacterium]|nr:ACT domain-containing protein [Alcaligenaceae bacterium]
MEQLIVTVLGQDRVGLVATIANCLQKYNINIIDITQKVLDNNIFSMVLRVESSENTNLEAFRQEIKDIEQAKQLNIFVQQENLFLSMHRI